MRISLEEAVELIKKNIITKQCENIFIGDGLGRVLSDDIYAVVDNPPFNRSPYDGYALKAKYTSGIFKVIGVNYAGKPSVCKISDKEAVKIMTGAFIPDGADCVVPQEVTDRGNEYVTVFDKYNPKDNFIEQGEDFINGSILLRKNTKLGAAEMALTVAGGVDRINVYPRLKTAVISTGNEIVKPDRNLELGQIYDTNMIYTSARLTELGCSVLYKDSVGDDTETIGEAIRKASENSDLVVTTGGVSVGEKDLLHEAVKDIGAEIIFHGVDMKPGMPTMLAVLNKKTVILSLSGNPFAAAVGLEVIGRYIISAISGDMSILPKRREVVLNNGFEKSSKSRRFIKGVEKDGRVTIQSSQGNGSMKSTVGCNCFVDIPAGSKNLSAGDKAVVLLV